MKKILVAALSLVLLSSAVFAAQSNPGTDEDDSITPAVSPKKVNMRANQLENLRGTMVTPKVGNSVDPPENTLEDDGKTGTNASTADTGNQPAMKVGKFLPSTRIANKNAQTQGFVGNSEVDDSMEGSGKIDHKNINKRTTEKLGDGFD